jgi:SPP1 family phage portal protein
MFYLNKDRELDIQLLHKMIEKFNLEEKPKLKKYKDYYNGKQAILNKRYSDSTKPCNHTVINYAKSIVDAYAGYLAAPGHISYRSDKDIEEIMDVLRYNDYQEEDAAFLSDLLIYGKAVELMYIDLGGQVRFRLIDPTTCFGIYDDSLSGDLMYFVRMYKADPWSDSDLHKVDVYSDNTIRHYEMAGVNGTPRLIEEENLYFSQCPANISYLADERSIFDCVLPLQDAANELLSSEIDDFQAFCDAYLVLTGGNLDNETIGADGLTDVQRMRVGRVLELPEGASASWLTKNANDAQIENIMKRIHDSIFRVAQCPDFSSETFVGGVSSGIAIRYRLCGMENRAAPIAAAMKKALQRRIEIIAGVASMKLGEEVFKDIEIEFKRNIPEDTAAIINMVNSLKGTVSDATLLSQIPFITDINKELELLQEQREANMELYGFGSPIGSEEEEEEVEE